MATTKNDALAARAGQATGKDASCVAEDQAGTYKPDWGGPSSVKVPPFKYQDVTEPPIDKGIPTEKTEATPFKNLK